MGFLRRIASILRFLHGAASEGDGDGDEDDNPAAEKGDAQPPPSANRRGFSVQVPLATTRHHAGPVLVPCNLGEGGVQGFKWCGERLKVDEDGDVADEFLDEALLPEEAPRLDNHTALPVFNIKCGTQPAVVRNQVIAADGSILHSVEHRGRLRKLGNDARCQQSHRGHRNCEMLYGLHFLKSVLYEEGVADFAQLLPYQPGLSFPIDA